MRMSSHIITPHVIAQATQPIENPIHRSATTAAGTSAPASSPASLDSGRVFAALVAVLALILLLRWALRRFIPASLARNARGVRVIARTQIAPKQQVLILQVGRRLLVVGDSSQQLNTLCEITDQDEAAALLGQLNGGASTSTSQELSQTTEPAPADVDPKLSSTRTELNGLAQRVKILAKHLSSA
jgi:flagellar biosynthetic protein FliO